ncbi:AAA family ATPase [Pseudoduganella chitinolytica]|uniref:AAA family ATPase n=1 Tax=Pseudoduganella chitinolytica TaxID=34070 RepID=A0ABY8BK68_9BURK|nr:AAA family ATPase [Pseudoduganella chitinolytica]WEF35808.1 AAA family ATPase [Pseudoduganella chitinolytica]
MYTQHFQLKQSPFSIAPDPRYLFMSERHREALAHLLYGVGSGGGFVLLTGEIGAGKTTVCRCFMEQIPANCRLAYIFNPKLSVEELLLSICDELRIELPADGGDKVTVKGYVDAINRHLLANHAQGLNNVLVIDEAQNLSAAVLEQLRLLTNLETSERKLLQIILIGQPELRTILARPELEQLAQRVIARYHLGSLTADETGHYIAHRLAVAGATGPLPFPAGLTGLVHQLTKGVPRRINLLCDRALLGAYVENRRQVTRRILRRAAAEVFAGEATATWRRPWLVGAAGVLAGAVLTAAAAWQLAPAPVQKTPATAAAPRLPALAPDDYDAHLHRLAGMWGVTPGHGDPCATAAREDLRCLQGKASLDELRRLDRPAVLRLAGGKAPTYALLTALDGTQATLELAGQRQRLALAELERRYEGNYTTYWRAPRTWRDEVGAGARGPDVDWLARRLAELRGEPVPREGLALDGPVLRWLREFQAAQHLKADGVAGPKTFIRLSQLAGVREPRLAGGGK